jgi:benzoate-CoA ligase
MTIIPSYFNLYDYFLGDARIASRRNFTAIEFRGGRITYGELKREVDFWTEQIAGCGISEGDKVALLLYDSPEWIACFLATISIGAVSVPINTFLTPQEVTYILTDSGARLVISEDDLEWKVETDEERIRRGFSMLVVDSDARHYLDPKDEIAPRPPLAATTRETPAFMLYTSGSTGTPKGALHRHGAVPHTVEAYSKKILRLTERDRVYSSSRLFFAYGLGNSLSFPLEAGATVILDSQRPTAERLASIFEEQSPTVFFGVPAIYRMLLDIRRAGARIDLSSVRLCISAGEALPDKIFEDWAREFGLEILDGIGSTEMLHIFISNREGEARPGSSGKLVEGYTARLVDDHGADVSGEGVGHLNVRGDSSMLGYWNRAELTARTLNDGWVRTGDIYRRTEDDYYYHVGRSDDCFKVRGMWVSPIEVETALLAHDAVTEAAVVEAFDERGLATARAYVVIRTDEASEALKEELRRLVGSRLPSYKVPSQIEFIEEMPRTSTGKIQRYVLRAGSRERAIGESDG